MSSRTVLAAASVLWLGSAGGAGAQDPACAAPAESAGIADGLLAGEPPAFAAANRARRELENPGADPAPQLAEALAAAGELRSEERLRVELHVARTLMRWAERDAEREGASRAVAERRLRAAELLGGVAKRARAAGEMGSLSYAAGYRAELYAASGRRREALLLADQALAAASAIDAPQLRGRWLGLRGRLLHAQGEEETALASYRSARAALDEARGRMDAAAFLALAEPVYLALVELLLPAGAAGRDPSGRLREARDVLEALTAAELRDYFHDECLAAQPQRPSEQLPGTVLLYPVLLRGRVELLVGRQGSFTRVTSPATPDEVIETARRLRKQLQDPTTRRYRQPAQQLYEWLLRPIGPLGGEGGVTLVWVPTGVLFEIPLAALVDGRSGEFLIEQVPLAVTPSLRLTDPRPIDRDRVELLAAGLTTAVEDFAPLEWVGDEVKAIQSAFPGMLMLDDAFSISDFERALTSHPFGIVHVASHGEFLRESGESFLLARDGRISMDELARLVGRTRFRIDRPLQLLTLSACSTAEGDSRAAFGLAGVAIRSGARSAVATLWRVNDQAAAELIGEFYRQLATPGVSRALALQRAQRKLIGDRSYRHPKFWAPFLLINSWL